MKNIYEKYIDVIPYLLFGIGTTLVNILTYWVLSSLIKAPVMLSTLIAWVTAVLFAYYTNRKWVFHSEAKESNEILMEIISFFGCRLMTGVIDWLIMFVFVEKIHYNDMLFKAMANVIVIFLNYIASKVIIFRNTNSCGNLN